MLAAVVSRLFAQVDGVEAIPVGGDPLAFLMGIGGDLRDIDVLRH